jgi:GT2 family glycosyltransferase
MQPLVTVNILSYNRKNELKHTLQKVFAQDYNNIEVIVVDNNSIDGSAEMVKTEYPDVRLIELQKNIGIAGWNEGAKIAKGEYLLFLDDDSYPEKRTLSSILPICEKNKIIALDIRNPEDKSLIQHELPIIPTFIGCGVIIPQDVFRELNGFEPLLFLYGHEEEFSMRALQKGYTLQFTPQMVVYHSQSRNNRLLSKNNIDKRKIYFKYRSSIVILLLHFPLYISIPRVFRLCLGRILFAIINRCLGIVLKSIYDGIVVSTENWNKRTILDKDVQKIFRYGKGIGSFFGGEDTGIKRPSWI